MSVCFYEAGNKLTTRVNIPSTSGIERFGRGIVDVESYFRMADWVATVDCVRVTARSRSVRSSPAARPGAAPALRWAPG